MANDTAVYLGAQLAAYNFGQSHPFGPARHDAFKQEFERRQLQLKTDVRAPVSCQQDRIELFHHAEYITRVKQLSVSGEGFLDHGDTPAFVGMYEASLAVAGSVCDGADRIMQGQYRHGFVPIAGLHHARRDGAAGFCVFNDCGIVIEHLRQQYGLQHIAYIDIDAHHGDGVYYGFESDADVIFVDLHEDGRFLYPGTGAITETGRGEARGCKLNIPMPPGADDAAFMRAWESAEAFLRKHPCEFYLLQCGADSIAGDPITHLAYTAGAHAHAAQRLQALANEFCQGRLLALGGGGYNLDNIAHGWNAVVQSLLGGEQA